MASLTDRLSIARTRTDRLPFIHVIAPEVRLPSNFTFETLKYLRATMPLARLVWVMGADNLVQFRQWKRHKDIIDLLPIAVIDRPGYSYQAISAGRQLFKRRYTHGQLRCKLVSTDKNAGMVFHSGTKASCVSNRYSAKPPCMPIA